SKRRMGRSVMTELDLDAIQARANAATDGPWERYGDGSHEVYCAATFEDTAYEPPDVTYGSDRPADAEFIAHARQDIPMLVAEVERLRAKSACTCSWVDPEYWTTHYEAIEPGSMQEYEPTCPIHGELRERAEMAEDEVERLTDMRERLREQHIAADEVIRAILRELGRGPDAEPVSETRQVVAEVERL